jgi:hypothetical protein
MKDFFGRTIGIGDVVCFKHVRAHSTELCTGVVSGFTPKMVRVEYHRYDSSLDTHLSAPHNCIKRDAEVVQVAVKTE